MKNVKISWLAVYLIGLAAVLVLYFNTVYLPQSQSTDTLQQQHNLNQQQLMYYDRIISGKADLTAQIDKLQKNKTEAAKIPYIPASGIGDDISFGLKKAGISADSITLSDETAVAGSKKSSTGQTLTQVTVSLSVKCTQQQLDMLLDYYEKKSAAVYFITSLSYTGGKKENSTAKTASAAPTSSNPSNTIFAFNNFPTSGSSSSSGASSSASSNPSSSASSSPSSSASSGTSKTSASSNTSGAWESFLNSIASIASNTASTSKASASSKAPVSSKAPASSGTADTNPTVSINMTAYYYSNLAAAKK